MGAGPPRPSMGAGADGVLVQAGAGSEALSRAVLTATASAPGVSASEGTARRSRGITRRDSRLQSFSQLGPEMLKSDKT